MLFTRFVQLLKAHGYRLTQERKLLLSVMTGEPLTVQAIFDRLKNQADQINLASIYRNLQLFEKLDLIQSVQLAKGKKHYELKMQSHHHHLVCQTCGVIADVTLPNETTLLQTAETQSGFKITQHSLEFFGTCAACQ